MTNNMTNNSFPSGLSLTPSAGSAVLAYYNEAVVWTPTVSGSTTAGVGTYSIQAGYYTRIGNMIFASAHIVWSAHSGTGNLLITNLPFNCRNLSNYDPEAIVNTINIALPGGTSRSAIGSLIPATNVISTYVTANSGANQPIALPASGEVHITIAYLT